MGSSKGGRMITGIKIAALSGLKVIDVESGEILIVSISNDRIQFVSEDGAIQLDIVSIRFLSNLQSRLDGHLSIHHYSVAAGTLGSFKVRDSKRKVRLTLDESPVGFGFLIKVKQPTGKFIRELCISKKDIRRILNFSRLAIMYFTKDISMIGVVPPETRGLTNPV